MRDSMVFYRSFLDAVTDLPPKDFKACVLAILQYGLDGIVPNGRGIEKTVFAMAKPQIDRNNQKYLNGSKGGRPRNQTETDQEPNGNQTETESEPKITEQKPTETETEKSKPNVYDNVNDMVINNNINTTLSRARTRVGVDEFERAVECEGWECYPGGDVYVILRDTLIGLINDGNVELSDISHKFFGVLLNSMYDGRERRQITDLKAYCLAAVQNNRNHGRRNDE